MQNFKYSTKYRFFYQIPKRYSEALYLANATFFDNVNWYIHKAYEVSFHNLMDFIKSKKKLTFNEAVDEIYTTIKMMEQCNSVLDIRFPVTLDNGEKQIIRGFRANHGCYTGYKPCLGGLKIDKNITKDHMKALSVISTYKFACMDMKMSGGFGGIKINPKKYSQNDLKNIVTSYAKELHLKGYCNGITDVIEPDTNSGEDEMSWIATNFSNTAAVGKSIKYGGIENFESCSSKGIFFAIDYFLNQDLILREIDLESGIYNKKFVIQGLGPMAQKLTKFLLNYGAICVGVKEVDGYIYDYNGINLQDLIQYRNQKGSIIDFPNVKPYNTDEIYIKPCDILIFADHQNSLTYHIAPKVQAKLIIEAANGAISPISHLSLATCRKLVLPDIYANSGSSVGAYLELLLNLKEQGKDHFGLHQDLYKNILDVLHISEDTRHVVLSSTTQKIIGCAMDHDVIAYAIEHVMVERAQEILNAAKTFKLGLDLRTAAYIIAIQNIYNSLYPEIK